MMRLMTFLALMSIMLLTVGCPPKDGAEGDAKDGSDAKVEAPKPGAETPEKSIEVMAKAFGPDGKWSESLSVMAPKEKHVLPFMLLFSASFMAAREEKFPGIGAEFKKILKDQGFEEPKEGKKLIDFDAVENPDTMLAETDRLFKGKDVGAFLNAMQGFMKKYDSKKEFEGIFGSVKDVKIEGDKATGSVAMTKDRFKDIEFVKVDGRWFISIQKFFN